MRNVAIHSDKETDVFEQADYESSDDWVRVILLFFTIGANFLQMAKNNSNVFAKLAKEFGDKESQPKHQ